MLKVNAEPERVGLCSKRLARIGPHFQKYIDEGKLSGVLTLVARKGQLAWLDVRGKMDIDSGRALEPDAIFRIYSMTKPVTSVAAMMLYEEGRFQLDDPIGRYLAAFADMQVFTGGTAEVDPVYFPQIEVIGDIANHQVLSLGHPDWHFAFDADPAPVIGESEVEERVLVLGRERDPLDAPTVRSR